MSMPEQKPGRSKQDWCTPKELLNAIRKRLGIQKFDIDLAATGQNAVSEIYFAEDEHGGALAPHKQWHWQRGGWCWCNPPYADIGPWVARACDEAIKGGQIAMLVPASVGAEWWKQYVDTHAYVLFLNGRITFVGASDPYPKDCALLLYTPWRATGNQIWNWREAA
jgi:phage N-6-adenine-methyltransferase